MIIFVIEYVPIDSLVLEFYVRTIYYLVLVGSYLHTLTDVHWFVCCYVYGEGEVCCLRIFFDEFSFS